MKHSKQQSMQIYYLAGRRARGFPLALLLTGMLFILLLSACGGGSQQLTYRAAGSASQARVFYIDGAGVLQEESVSLPWETTIEIGGDAFDFQLIVANHGSDGEVTCQVLLNDEAMTEAAGSAAYIDCNGDVSKNGSRVSYHFSSRSGEVKLKEAEALYDKSEYEAALTEVDKILELAPNFASAYFLQGLCHKGLGDMEQALGAYSQAIEMDPALVKAYNNRGLIYQEMEDTQAAFADWTTAIDLDPEYAMPYFNRARAYFTQENYAAAQSDVLKVQELSDDPEMLEWADGALAQLSSAMEQAETEEAEQVAVAKEPSAGQFVFYTSVTDAQRRIHALNIDKGDMQPITPEGAYNWDASISPDGQKVVFVSAMNGDPDIYSMNLDGSNLVRLTNDPAADYAPAWSPDGSMIAFVTDRNGNADVYAMSADGARLVQVTLDPAHDYYPTWNADGTEIAFVSERDGDAEIFIFNTDGSVRQVTQNDFYDADPAWSPNGRVLAFSSAPDGTQSDIYVVNPDGSELQQVTMGPADDIQPNWSADSNYILFSSDRDTGTMEIYMMAESGDTVRLTNNDVDDRFPSWGPLVAP